MHFPISTNSQEALKTLPPMTDFPTPVGNHLNPKADGSTPIKEISTPMVSDLTPPIKNHNPALEIANPKNGFLTHPS